MSSDVYVLDESEYEIVETKYEGLITSEEVKSKLEEQGSDPIEQEDFDDRDFEDEESEGYTLKDYLWIDEGQYPRDFRDRDSLAANAVGLGLFSSGHYIVFQDASIAGTAVAAAPPAMYVTGLRDQDQDLGEALKNSVENILG